MRRTARAACSLSALSLMGAIAVGPRATSTDLATRPIDFVANRGQWDRRIDFAGRYGSMTAVVRQATVTLGADVDPATAISLAFEGASSAVSPTGEQPRATHYNFYLGSDSSRWRSDVPAFGAVAWRDLYRGVSVRLHEQSARLEYELRLDRGADLDQVVIRADGTSNAQIEPDGSLRLETKRGALRQSAPRSWHELPDGRRRVVASRFRKIDDRRYGFEVDGRDPALPLVIDPGLVWSTFLGGSGPDFIGPAASARDGSGDVFVGGTMASVDFPSFADPSFAPGTQSPAFVVRLNSSGTAIRYATFVGGWHAQIVHRGLAVDAAGNAVLVGQTYSPDFPTTAGAFDRVGVNKDAFVVRLNATGGLIFSTLLGGSGEDDASAVAYDPAGNIIVGGTTASRDFPTTPTAFHPSYNVPNAPADGGAEGDMFVARLMPDGTALTYGTFLGGPQTDVLEDLVVDANGVVTVCGWLTGNNVQVFVTTPGAFDRTWNGSQDAAIARLKLDGAGAADLKYATLIGGASQDNLWLAAIDPTNPELVTFAGRSWSNNYPTTAGVVRPTNPPFSPLFPDVEAGIITRFRFPAAGGGSLVWSTYHHSDRITGLAVNANGEPIVAGPSAPWDMVTTRGALDRTADGSGAPGAGFLSRLSADATQYLYQTFFGGSGGIADNFQSVPQVAYVAANTVVVSGQTTSNDFPITAGAADPVSSNAIGGGASNEGFVTKFALDADASGDVAADAPQLTSPIDGAIFHNGLVGRLDWNGVADPSGVHAYEFQVSSRSDFAKDFILYRGAVPATSVIIPPSVGSSGGLSLITFFWRVRTADNAGNLSAWSAARTFTVSPSSGQPTISGIQVDSSSVVGGAQATGMLQLYDPAPPGGLVARLVAVHDRSQGLDRTRALPVPVSVPDTVNVPAGALSAPFSIATSPVTMAMGVSLVATIDGVGGTGSISVTPADFGGPTPSDVTLLPGSVIGGTPATGIVTINQPAPAGGVAVALSSSHPAIAGVPASVTVAAGARTANFPVATSAVTTEVDVTLVATSSETAWNQQLYVRPANHLPKLTSMTISPTSVAGGANSGGTLTFSGPIPLGVWPALPDAVVRIRSSDPDVAALFPGDDYVLAGSTSHAFRIFTRGVPSARNVTFTAYFDSTALSGVLTVGAVTGVTVSSLGANVTTLRGGEGGVATVTLGAAAPAPLLVAVSTNHPELFSSLPPNLTVFTGSTSASFAFVTNKTATASTPVTISASYGASAASLPLTVNPAASTSPPVIGVSVSPASVTGGASSSGTVTLQSAAPSGGAVVQLFSSSAAASVPASVSVAAGAATATFPIATTSVSADTTVTITALQRLSAATSLVVRAGASPPPAAPTLLSPANGATPAQPVAFDWSDVAGAVSYEIQVDDSTTFTAPLVIDQTVTPSAFSAGGFAGVQHSWRVRAINSAGTAGAFSSVRSFTPQTAPAAPALSAISLNPTSVVGGNAVQGTASLTSAAPAGGASVTLSSSNTVATVPASVAVPAGATSATFSVATTAVSASTSATITGAFGGATKTAALTVTPPPPPGTGVALTVTATGRSGERVTSSPAGISVAVGSTGSASFASGTSITLTVSNGRDAIWSGACSSGGNKTKACTFTLNAAASVTANVQ